MRILKNRLDQGLAVLFVMGIAMIFLANEDPFARHALCVYTRLACFESIHAQTWNNILYDLGIGSVISLFFYVLIVRLPDAQRRLRIKSRSGKKLSLGNRL